MALLLSSSAVFHPLLHYTPRTIAKTTLKMTSHYAQYRELAAATCEAYDRTLDSPSLRNRLDFFYDYLVEVAPLGVHIRHIPQRGCSSREEVQLVDTSERIIMSGLISLEYNPNHIEEVAGDEAYTKWDAGYFVPDDTWRFFTGTHKIRFFKSQDGNDFELRGSWHPIKDVEQVAAYLQQEYDRLRLYQRL